MVILEVEQIVSLDKYDGSFIMGTTADHHGLIRKLAPKNVPYVLVDPTDKYADLKKIVAANDGEILGLTTSGTIVDWKERDLDSGFRSIIDLVPGPHGHAMLYVNENGLMFSHLKNGLSNHIMDLPDSIRMPKLNTHQLRNNSAYLYSLIIDGEVTIGTLGGYSETKYPRNRDLGNIHDITILDIGESIVNTCNGLMMVRCLKEDSDCIIHRYTENKVVSYDYDIRTDSIVWIEDSDLYYMSRINKAPVKVYDWDNEHNDIVSVMMTGGKIALRESGGKVLFLDQPTWTKFKNHRMEEECMDG